ncbi:MAG: AGE family epimerase/isomerase [Propionibacteriaceae bacterium]|nr:AGE family epimerase/isomerase [Propionibacteriaceae bacterium]
MIGDAEYRRALRAELLRFGVAARTADGFGNLDSKGRLEVGEPTQLYVTGRFTHVYSLGLLAREVPAPGGPSLDEMRALAEHGIGALLDGPLRDDAHGGWFDANGGARNKTAYGHSFVLLAASSGLVAGIAGASDLLSAAADVLEGRFFDEGEGLVVDDWDAPWTHLDSYRGLNSNMHTVECFLAVGDATGDRKWLERAAGIGRRAMGWAEANDWRMPEHFTERWEPMLEYNRDQPTHPFRPYGATVGHGLEWARLLASTALAVGEESLSDGAVALADRAVSDGWGRDGEPGFVYTTDWSGHPVSRARMHWVLCEAIATSSVLERATGLARFGEQLEMWWDFADRFLVDREHGSWHHELDEKNVPSGGTWSGKADIYHAYQAGIIQDVPLAPSFARAVEAGIG